MEEDQRYGAKSKKKPWGEPRKKKTRKRRTIKKNYRYEQPRKRWAIMTDGFEKGEGGGSIHRSSSEK